MSKLISEGLPEPEGKASDSSLLKRLRFGDFDAATQLYIRYANRLRLLAQAQCSPTLARHVGLDDIVQSVFGSFFRRAADGVYDVPDGNELWNLLLVITLNKIRAKAIFHQARKRDVRRTTPGVDLDDWFTSTQRSDNGPYAILRMVVDEALQDFEEQDRRMICLRIDGYQVDEIAAKTGRSKRTVERLLQEFRKKLSAVLEQQE
jgi:RNA polymerase sigma factor (sigma-70 family)